MNQNPAGLSDIRRITAPAILRPDTALAAQRGASAVERYLLRWLLRAIGNPPV